MCENALSPFSNMLSFFHNFFTRLQSRKLKRKKKRIKNSKKLIHDFATEEKKKREISLITFLDIVFLFYILSHFSIRSPSSPAGQNCMAFSLQGRRVR